MSKILRALAWLLALAMLFATAGCDLDKLSKDKDEESSKKKKKKKKKKRKKKKKKKRVLRKKRYFQK